MRKSPAPEARRAPHKRWNFLVALVCGLAVVVGGWLAEAKRAKEAPAAPAAQCKKDQDCVAVMDDCCTCTSGGRQKAIPRKEKAAYERDRKKECFQIMCAQVMSQDPTCAEVPTCDAGVCKMGAAPAPPAPAKP